MLGWRVWGHLHVWPDLTVSADLSFVSTFIFDVLHSSDICLDIIALMKCEDHHTKKLI